MSEAFGRRGHQFTTVHALRGVAALWVVLFHSYNFGALTELHLDPGNELVRYTFEYGRGGVAMFFVISGFVIAHSLRTAAPDWRFAGRFMLRRSIRLDPPYWLSIVVVLALGFIAASREGRPYAAPQFSTIIAHLFYLQELLRKPEIQVVYWTLTYEIQFYFVYMLSVWWRHASLQRARNAIVGSAVPGILIALAFVAAVETREWAPHGIFLNYWDAFMAGTLAYAAGFQRNNLAAMLLMALVLLMVISAPMTVEVFKSPAALTAIGLFVAGRVNALSTGMNAKPIQFLGTISYSLYLMHVPAILVGMSIVSSLSAKNPALGLLRFPICLGLAILGSSVFWWLVERPSHHLASTLSLKPAPQTAAAVALSQAP